MKVLADFHHSDLYYSLVLLFERRLGWELYRPIGTDWFEEGFWKIAEPYGNAPDTINQYLGINDKSWDPYHNLNGNYRLEDGIYKCFDPVHDYHHKAITLKQFKEMDFDLIISSIPAHDESFERLLPYAPKAKHIAQVGNIGQSSNIKDIMWAAAPINTNPERNVVSYHQEFDLSVYSYTQPYNFNKVRSLMNCLPQTADYPLYIDIKARMSDFDFKSYGGSCDDGSLHKQTEIAKEIQDASFIWHVKPGGDGFGHIVHNAAACGRPLITKKEYYRGQLAEQLMEDQVTCITIDGKSPEQIIEEIRHWAKPENLLQMAARMHAKFQEVVNYDGEEKQLRMFLSKAGISN